MALVTLRELRRRARARADMLLFGDDGVNVEPDYTNSFIPNNELNELINTFSKEYYNVITQADGEDYFISTQTYSPSAQIALPSDFYKLDCVKCGDSILERASKLEIKKNKPQVPSATITINYVPTLKKLVDSITDSSTQQLDLDGINGFEEYIVLRTAMAMKAKEQSGIEELLAEFKLVQKRIEEFKEDRDEWMPDSIQDVTDSYNVYDVGMNSYKYRIIGSSVHFIGGSFHGGY